MALQESGRWGDLEAWIQENPPMTFLSADFYLDDEGQLCPVPGSRALH
jgi:hypothetical protein